MFTLGTLKYYLIIVQIVIRTFIDVHWKVKISKIKLFKLKLWKPTWKHKKYRDNYYINISILDLKNKN